MSKPLTLITGGSRGIGRALALELATRGHDLILTWHQNPESAAQTAAQVGAAGARVATLQLDAGASATFPAFAQAVRATLRDTFGRDTFTGLVNNAGHGCHAPFADTTEAQLDSVFSVHFKGPFLLTQALLPLLADGSSVLNVSSGLARVCRPGYAAYGAMKAAVEALTRYQAQELAARHIRVNVAAPGALATDFGGGAVRDNPSVNAYIASQTALGRVGEAEDAARTMAAMLSPDFGWVTGQRVEISGGFAL